MIADKTAFLIKAIKESTLLFGLASEFEICKNMLGI